MFIKEAAEKLGIEAHTIRYYEQEGLLPLLDVINREEGYLMRLT